VDERERNEVVQQFVVEGRRQRAASRLEGDESLGADLVADEFVSGSSQRGSVSLSSEGYRTTERLSFGQLVDAIPTRMICDALRDEHPQTVAVVVTRLSPRRAAEFLALLLPSQQVDVARRVAELGQMDAEILADIEQEVVERLTEEAERCSEQSWRGQTLQNILQAADDQARAALMKNIRRQDCRLAERLGMVVDHHDVPGPHQPQEFAAIDPVVSFNGARFKSLDELVLLDDDILRSLLQEAELDVAAIAIAGASTKFVTRVLAVLSPDELRLLEQHAMKLMPLRVSDIDHAQQELLHRAAQSLPDSLTVK
jgi:flagellar motor switch protein FliG